MKTCHCDRLAKEFYVSKYHIAHIFKDNIGISVHQYITKKRFGPVPGGNSWEYEHY